MNHDECKTYIKNSLLEIRKLANIYTLETFKKELEKRNIYLETKLDKYFSSEGEDYIYKLIENNKIIYSISGKNWLIKEKNLFQNMQYWNSWMKKQTKLIKQPIL